MCPRHAGQRHWLEIARDDEGAGSIRRDWIVEKVSPPDLVFSKCLHCRSFHPPSIPSLLWPLASVAGQPWGFQEPFLLRQGALQVGPAPSVSANTLLSGWVLCRPSHGSQFLEGFLRAWLNRVASTPRKEWREQKEKEGLKAQRLEWACRQPSSVLGGLNHSIPLQISYTQLSLSLLPVPLGLGGKGSPAWGLHTAHGEQRLQPTPPRQLLSVRQEHRSAGSWQRCPKPSPPQHMQEGLAWGERGVCKGFESYREGIAPKNIFSAHMSLRLKFHH